MNFEFLENEEASFLGPQDFACLQQAAAQD
jgi:hypothetical protein